MSVSEKIWTERHRPNTLDDLVGQEEAVERMKKWVDDPSCPHLILNGPAGSGKSSAAVAFAKDKYGDKWRSNLHEMNASDDRGIDVVRNQIKEFARESPDGDFNYKIIFLDEADNLTKDAMSALRRVMEKYSDQTRFFLSMNYLNKVIDPIQSRCTVLPFNKLQDNEIEQLITRILNEEGIEYQESAINKIVEYVDGDARRAVQTLQTSVEDGELTEDLLDVVGGQVDREVLDEMLSDALRGNMESVHNSLVYDVIPNTIDYSRLLNELMKTIRDSEEVHDDIRWYLIAEIGDTERAIQNSANPNIQLMSFFAEIPVAQASSMPGYQEK